MIKTELGRAQVWFYSKKLNPRSSSASQNGKKNHDN